MSSLSSRFGVVSQTMASNALPEGHLAEGSASRGFGPKLSFCKLQMLLNLALEWEKIKMGPSQSHVRAEGFYSNYSSAVNSQAIFFKSSVDLQLLI